MSRNILPVNLMKIERKMFISLWTLYNWHWVTRRVDSAINAHVSANFDHRMLQLVSKLSVLLFFYPAGKCQKTKKLRQLGWYLAMCLINVPAILPFANFDNVIFRRILICNGEFEVCNSDTLLRWTRNKCGRSCSTFQVGRGISGYWSF